MPTTTIADVNWLLSALTQATAALIAIVGGLLVSRYVALHAEQQAAVRRVDDLRRRESETETREQLAKQELDLYYVDDFLDDDDIFEMALAKSLEPTVADALAAGDGEDADLNQELLAIRLRELCDELGHAFRALDPLVPAGKDHARWLDVKRQHNFEIAQRSAWEWMYEQLCEQRRAATRMAEEEARSKTPYGNLFPSANFDILSALSLGNPQVAGLRNVVKSQQEIAHVGALRERVEQAQVEVRALQQERRLATETLDATRQPEGFALALRVLSVIAVLGMGIPVVLMGFGPVELPTWLRTVVIGLFFLGVVLLLRFLFVYAAFLRGSHASLPSTILGLLRRASSSRGQSSSTRGA